MNKDSGLPRCFVCGMPEKEHEEFTETEDGLMCPGCVDEIDDLEDMTLSTIAKEDNVNDI